MEQRTRGPYAKITNEERKQIVEAYLEGQHASTISVVLNEKRSTVKSAIKGDKTYIKENRREGKLRGGPRERKLTDEHVAAVKSWIDEDCGLSLAKIGQKLFEEYSVDVSATTIARYIDSFSYSLKRTYIVPVNRNDPVTVCDRRLYVLQASSYRDSELFFADEVGFNVSMRTRRGRAPVGERAVHVVPPLRSRSVG